MKDRYDSFPSAKCHGRRRRYKTRTGSGAAMGTNCAKWLEAVCATVIKKLGGYRAVLALGRSDRRMRAVNWIAAALLMSSAPAMGQSPNTFDAAKKLLSDIHEDIGHLETLYCGCPYTRTGRSGGDVDRDACGLEARKNDERSDRPRVGARRAGILARERPSVLDGGS